jgi:thioredoxin-like negative regulator of GroEL
MKTSIRRLLTLALGLVLALPCSRAEETAPMFRDLSFDAALKQAATDQKFVFVDFYTTWCGPCKMLDQTTWKDPQVIALITSKAIPLKIDAEKEADLSKRYRINVYPSLLVIRPDGTEVDRIIGFKDAEPFREAFNKVLALAAAGKSSIQAAAEAVDTADPEEAKPRFDLAKKLAQEGDNQKALDLLLWCWDEGKKDPDFVRTRVLQVGSALAALSRDYPQARDAMISRRDQSRQRVIDGKGGKNAVDELIQLNKQLREDDDSIAVLDKIPAGDERRTTFSIYLFDKLVEAKRYKDAYWRTITMSSLSMLKVPNRVGKEIAETTRSYTIRRTTLVVEALAGSDHLDDAREVLAALLEFDHSAETRALIRVRLERAGHADLLPSEAEAAPAAATPATKT